MLEARLLALGAKDSRRKDLLQLQASAHDDLQRALSDALPPDAKRADLLPSAVAGNADGLSLDLRDVHDELRRALKDALLVPTAARRGRDGAVAKQDFDVVMGQEGEYA